MLFNGESRALVADDEPVNRLSLRDEWVKLKVSGEYYPVVIFIRGIFGMCLEVIKELYREITTCDQLGLETLGSWTIVPKTLPGQPTIGENWLLCAIEPVEFAKIPD